MEVPISKKAKTFLAMLMIGNGKSQAGPLVAFRHQLLLIRRLPPLHYE